MIVHVEYRCPECDKVFNCPANLASHRRWHKPKNNNNNEENNNKATSEPRETPSSQENEAGFLCEFCFKTFKGANSLKKHIIQVHPDTEPPSPLENSPKKDSPLSSPNSKYSIAELLSNSPKSSTSEKNIPCLSCSETFGTVTELSHHLSTEHRPLGVATSPKSTAEMPLLRPQPFVPTLLSGSNFPR